MLDSNILGQLKQHFSNIESSVQLAVTSSEHDKSKELIDYATDIATTSAKIEFVKLDTSTSLPELHIHKEGIPTGIAFRGIPGGHEFTSLILGILYADGKGRQPDSGVIHQIKAIQVENPIELRTYISLSCTNCPDVVQALNLIASHHPMISHVMIDGGLCPDELESHNIQGVPTVMVGDEVVHVGKSELSELLAKLEEKYGTAEVEGKTYNFDVLVLGAGPAGASAAIYAARKGLKTGLVSQNIGGQVKETQSIENLISNPLIQGKELAQNLYSHIKEYDIEILENRTVTGLVKGETNKTLSTQNGDTLIAKTVIVASGAKWRQLGIPGEKDYMGQGVHFCPHCDGPFYKGKKVVVVGGGNSGIEAAIDLSGIASEVTVLEFGDTFRADQVLIDKANSTSNITLLKEVASKEIKGNGKSVTHLSYTDRTTNEEHQIDVEGIFVQIGLSPNSDFLEGTEVERTKMGEIVIDERCATNVPGIFAAGDVSTVPYKQIVIAMGEGAKASLSAFDYLIRN